MVLVKICGITNLDDALAAADAGADALGFNFYLRSPRYLAPQVSRTIIDRLLENYPNVLTVGVFVNESLEAIREIAEVAGVAALQLHGNESPEYCKALQGRHLIKAFSTSQGFVPEKVLDYDVRAVMLDAVDKDAFGGTGKLSDWSVARETRALVPKLFLAGGLSAENVADAINQVKPYAVDACSRLESAPGQKDQGRVRAFIAAVRAATL
ncbi:MAG TPA: phosphoribosylanthranilate isomerase [Pyrinomonadaceae bacterium]|jgi:phosphoribosylanthranilate isomerase|nr:phosphoribosylanthranilate isomerase [Pyrinomonadaceae bacterium]